MANLLVGSAIGEEVQHLQVLQHALLLQFCLNNAAIDEFVPELLGLFFQTRPIERLKIMATSK